MTKEITLAPVLGVLTATGWQAPQDDLTQAQWLKCGEQLARVEGAASWWLGDWWAYGENRKYGDGEELAERVGVKYSTVTEYGTVARAFKFCDRSQNVDWTQHLLISRIKDYDERLKWLARAEKNKWTKRELRGELLRLKRVRRHELLATPSFDQRFSLIYADPPWKFELHSDLGGEMTSADNHYSTMDLDAICDLEIDGKTMLEVADDDAALFLWTTSPCLEQAFKVIAAWGFEYKSCFAWDKMVSGTGYIWLNQHELLLYASRGEVPPPLKIFPSLMSVKRGKHSAKPPEVRAMLEAMYPKLKEKNRLEMFARGEIPGWTVWGNEAQ